MAINTKINLYILVLAIFSFTSGLYYFSIDDLQIYSLLFFMLIALLSEKYKIPVFIQNSKDHVHITWSSVVSIAALLSLGVVEAIIISAFSGFLTSIYPNRLPAIKLAYNIFSNISTVLLTKSILVLMFLLPLNQSMQQLFVPLLISIIYIIFNYMFGTMLMKMITGKKVRDILIDMIFPHLPYSLMFALIGALYGIWFKTYGLITIVPVLLFIMLISYGFKASTNSANSRVKELADSNTQINDLAKKLDLTFDDFIQTLSATIDARDPFTYGHSLQVSNYAVAIASEMELDINQIERIRLAGLLHDIGKISIPETILFKKGRLTQVEYEIMKQHVVIGEEIVSKIHSLSDVAEMIGYHHERMDGSGYPRGLKGHEISIEGHILGVADTLDAILSSRSYKMEKSVDEAMAEFARCRGTLFNESVVDSLFRLREKLGDKVFQNSANLVDEESSSILKTNKKIHEILSEKIIFTNKNTYSQTTIPKAGNE
ncbi:HD-GYP domain-containing protein [Bacillus sp. SCS-153A]|uniref:HD-GYP domain-containing protein n=1 Tax=Rossellomorea sedimentorum TaxID=3115294 RepID=UPI003905C5A3